jgi:hypothetical protein
MLINIKVKWFININEYIVIMVNRQQMIFDKRSLIQTGNSFLVCLPQSWCIINKLTRKDRMVFEWNIQTNELTIRPMEVKQNDRINTTAGNVAPPKNTGDKGILEEE